MHKSQSSSEFIILLSLIIILTAISVAVINPASIFNFAEKNSFEYWSSSPISLKVSSYDNRTLLSFRNNLRHPINITALFLGSTNISVSPIYLVSGNKSNFISDTIIYPASYPVLISYSIAGTNFSFDGTLVDLVVIKAK